MLFQKKFQKTDTPKRENQKFHRNLSHTLFKLYKDASIFLVTLDAKSLYKQLGIIEKYGISEGQQQNLTTYADRKKEGQAVDSDIIFKSI